MIDETNEELDDNKSFAEEVADQADKVESQPAVLTEDLPATEAEEEAVEKIVEEVVEPKKDEDLEAKRKAYKDRQEKRKRDEESRKQQSQMREKADTAQETDRTAYLEQVARKIEFDDQVKTAKNELSVIEKEYTEAYPDYTATVNDAIEFTKLNLMKKGVSEAQAMEQIEYEKIMLADAAVRRGEDPAEAVYREAQNINSVIEEFAIKRGYTKVSKKTNLQKQREISKPNAMQGGHGTKGVRTGLMDDDNSDLSGMTLGEMLAAKKSGAL